MPRTDFDKIDETKGGDFTPTPKGTYLCRKIHSEAGSSKSGAEQWNLGWEIMDGQFKGRKFFDNITWNFQSDGCMRRTKLACRGLGIDVRGEREVNIEDLADVALVTVKAPEKYTTPEGQTRHRNEVEFDGYQVPTEEAVAYAREAASKTAAGDDGAGDVDPDGELPF